MLSTYIATDRRHALAAGAALPDRQDGTVLFADIAGFTPLAEAMERVHGAGRGAEALATCVNRIFDALVDEVDRHRGSIVAFAGDAITCWFQGDRGLAAVACALRMQSAMEEFGHVEELGPGAQPLGLKVAVAGGEAHRFVAGDPDAQLLDVLAGAVVDRAGAGEKVCRRGEVLVDDVVAEALGDAIAVADAHDGFARVTELRRAPEIDPWPALAPDAIDEPTLRSWLLPAVYDRLLSGHSHFLAEFRPVAALFVSQAAIELGDAAVQARLDAFIRRMQDVVARHGGSVFDVSIGDKGSCVLAVFGAPVAYGDDVRRAVAAADELRRGAGGDLQIGVHADRVYAALYSGRTRSVYDVKGAAVNLAARLMSSAKPGQVLLSGAVGAALDRRFTIHALEPIAVKGVAAPVAVCELIGTAAPALQLSEPRYALPLVGREAELGILAEALDAAADGRGGVLALCADAGMGKSRLVNEAMRLADGKGVATFAGSCQPHGAGIAYLVWHAIFNALFGLPANAPDEERRAALSAALAAAAPEAVPLAPLLERVLDLPMEDTDATRGMPAPARKQVLEQFLAGWLRGRAQQGPLCIVLEDVHWIGSLSRDLLTALAGAIEDVPVLFLLAYRPPQVGQPIPVPAARRIDLGELPQGEAAQLAAMLLSDGGATADAAKVAAIVERANGNPFYIEELVRDILERGGTMSDLPTSLENVVLGRIDRLVDSQQLTMKVASVIGRRVPTGWLSGAYAGTLDAARLPDDLTGLSTSGLIVPDTPPPDEAYLFRHAIVREVAYETLGYGLRQTLHEQLAAHLEAHSASPPVDLLAYHYALSADTAKEALYRRLAAELAIRHGAYADALAHVERASEIVAAQPEGTQRLEQELELALLLGTILLVIDGQGSAKAKAVYDRARELSRAVPPGPAAGRAIFGLWTYYLFQGLMGPTEELADEAVALTERSPDPSVRVMAHLAVCQTHLWTGNWDKCVEHFRTVLELYDPAQHQAVHHAVRPEPALHRVQLGLLGEWMLGNPERAWRRPSRRSRRRGRCSTTSRTRSRSWAARSSPTCAAATTRSSPAPTSTSSGRTARATRSTSRSRCRSTRRRRSCAATSTPASRSSRRSTRRCTRSGPSSSIR